MGGPVHHTTHTHTRSTPLATHSHTYGNPPTVLREHPSCHAVPARGVSRHEFGMLDGCPEPHADHPALPPRLPQVPDLAPYHESLLPRKGLHTHHSTDAHVQVWQRTGARHV